MTSQRCTHCGTKLRGAPAFCPSCGARVARVDGGVVELDLSERAAAPLEAEVVFERPSGRRGKTIGLGVAAALAVAVGASVLSGGNGDTATPATTTIDPGPTTAVDLPSTTVADSIAAPTTSTTLGPFTVAPGPLLGEPTGLSLAIALGSELYTLDLDTGTATPAGYDEVNQGQVSLLTSVGVVVNDVNGTPDLLRPGAVDSERLVADATFDADLGGATAFIGEGPPGRLWVLRYGGLRPAVGYVDAGAGSSDLVLLDGVDVTFGGAQVDGMGGVLFTAAGGTYRVDERRLPHRVSPGALTAAGNGHALVVECDETFACGFRGLDLVSGESWAFGAIASGALFDTTSLSLSPDGRHFARLVAPDGQPAIVVGEPTDIEIAGVNGTETIRAPVAGFGMCGLGGCASPLVWSNDGRWLLGLRSSDSIWAWRPGLASPVVIELPLDPPVRVSVISVLIGAWPTESMPVRPAS